MYSKVTKLVTLNFIFSLYLSFDMIKNEMVKLWISERIDQLVS